MIKSIEIKENSVVILDQTQLPQNENYLEITDYRSMIEAIKSLRIRGAPALGIAAVAAAWLAVKERNYTPKDTSFLENAFIEIEASRPTAVNLFHAMKEVRKLYAENMKNICRLEAKLIYYCNSLQEKERTSCEQMAANGLTLFDPSARLKILTHCNTGSLATTGAGTALGLIAALAKRQKVTVYVDETRPLLQGSRLTMWELGKLKIESYLITDNMAASIIKSEKIDCIITGADRIAANGDTANKIGTLNLAILAKYFSIPFYIVAPETSFDLSTPSGKDIIIEERLPQEVRGFRDCKAAPDSCLVRNPAFDVTPANLITSIITDKQIYHQTFIFQMQTITPDENRHE